jgi:integrase
MFRLPARWEYDKWRWSPVRRRLSTTLEFWHARGLGEYLLICEREGVDPVTANHAHVAVFVRELTSRPSLRGANVVAIDSGAGLVVRRIALASGVERFSTHTTRHLCLTDLARMGWEVHAIAAFAGHRHTDSTLRYIHLSGRELADKLS